MNLSHPKNKRQKLQRKLFLRNPGGLFVTFSDEGYLFILQHVPEEYISNKKENETDDEWREREELRKIDDNTFTCLYLSLSEKCQKDTTSETYNIIRSHNMRKYFNNTLKNNGVENFFVERLMGHKPSASNNPYFEADPILFKERYKQQCEVYLTIKKELNVSESEDFKRIKAEHEILLIEAEKHRVERSELQALREEIENLKKLETKREKLKAEFQPLIMEDKKEFRK